MSMQGFQKGKGIAGEGMKWLSSNWRQVLYVGLAILLMWKIVFTSGIIGFHHDWGIPYDTHRGELYLNQFFHFWRLEDLGRNPVYPTDYWYRLVVGILGYLGVNGSILGKALVLWSIAFAGISMDWLLSQEGYSPVPVLVGSLFYMLSPVMFNKIAAGHVYFTLAYAVSPAIIELFLRAGRAESAGYWRFIPVGILVGLAGVQIQFMPMLGLIMLVAAATAPTATRRRLLVGLATVVGLAVLVHLPWLIQLFNWSVVAETANNAATFSWLEFMSNTWGSAVRLIGYRVGGFKFEKEIGEGAVWYLVSYSIPVLAVLGGVIGRGKHVARMSLVAAIVGVVATVGAAWPLESIVRWLFLHVSFINMFREFYHLMFVPAFGYAVLLTSFVEEVDLRLPNLKTSIALPVIVCLFATPFLNGGLNHIVQVVPRASGAADIQRVLAGDQSDSRVLWTPIGQPIRPPGAQYAGIDPEVKGSAKPAMPQELIGGRGSLSEGYALNQYANLLNGQTKNLAYQLSLAAVKYVVDRPTLKSEYPGFTYAARFPQIGAQWNQHRVSGTLEKVPDLERVGTFGDMTLYENRAWTPMTVVTNKPVLAGGELMDLGAIGDLPVGRSQGVVLASQGTALDASTMVVSNDSWLDIVSSFVARQHVIEPGRFTTVENDAEKGWVSAGYWWWYDPYLAGLAEQGAFTQMAGAVHDFSLRKAPGRYAILVKALHWPKGGNVEFSWSGKALNLDTFSQSPGYVWTDLGDLESGDSPFRMTNRNGENVVADIAVVPRVELGAAQEKAVQRARENGSVILRSGAGLGTVAPQQVPFDATWLGPLDANHYKAEIQSSGGLNVTVHFGSDNDEYSTLYKEVNVDLRQFPTMALTYSVDDPEVSTVQVGFDVDYDGDGKADALVWGSPPAYEQPAPTSSRLWSIDALSVAQQGAERASQYRLVGVRLLAHKLWGVKKEQLNKPEYTFAFQSLQFLPETGLTGLANNHDTTPAKLFVPAQGTYDVYVKLKESQSVNLAVHIGEHEVGSGQKELGTSWTKLGTVPLSSGVTNLAIETDATRTIVSSVALVPQGMGPIESVPNDVVRHSFDRYDVSLQVPAKGGELLVFKQGYDSGWAVEADGKTLKPIVVNGFANGFVIPKDATHLKLHYRPQTWYVAGLLIGWGGIATLMGLWAYVASRRRKDETLGQDGLEMDRRNMVK